MDANIIAELQRVAELPEDERVAYMRALPAEVRDEIEQKILLPLQAREDSPAGFAAFFRLLHGSPLHSEGVKWVENIYKARESGKGLLQKCHRESGKTTVFSKFFFAHQIGIHPDRVHGVCRINDDKAEATTEAVGRIIKEDPRWKLVFPHIVPDEAAGWGAKGYEVRDINKTEDEWAKIVTERPPNSGTFVGRGWKSGSWIGDRFNGTFIVDDIHDEKNTESARELEAVKRFYTKTLTMCIMKEALEIWNYTPWLSNDLYAFVEGTGEYLVSETPVMKPAAVEADGALYWPPTPLNPDYPEAGNIIHSGKWWHLYWPEAWNFERLAKFFRKSSLKDFALMMLLDLEAAKGINLKSEWLHEYPAAEIKPSWPVYMGIDYASTADKLKNKDSDFFALAVMRVIPGGGMILVDGLQERLSKGEALGRVVSYSSLYPTLQMIGVETHGTGKEFYNDLVMTNDVYGKPLPLMEVQHGRKSKGARFEDWLAPIFKNARAWVTDTQNTFVKSFKDEWLSWPQGQHDDCLDAVYMACVAGEGFLPSQAVRAYGRQREHKVHPFAALGR